MEKELDNLKTTSSNRMTDLKRKYKQIRKESFISISNFFYRQIDFKCENIYKNKNLVKMALNN